MSIPTNVLQLRIPKTITGTSSATVSSAVNAVEISNVLIDINPLHPGSIKVTLRYGTISNGTFTLAPISSDELKQEVLIENDDLLLLGDTPLSPVEREMTPFTIIEYRIFAALLTKGIIKLG